MVVIAAMISAGGLGEIVLKGITPRTIGLGAADGEVMLAAVVYDGDAVLYRNMRIVENAVQAVSDKYENVYFTYINTSK